MAEKYNLPGLGTRPLFFRHPRGRGGVVAGTGYPFAKPARRPPVTWFNDLGSVPVSVIGTHQHWTIRIVIESPANHPISKQSVISLVRIICIERTSAKSAPL